MSARTHKVAAMHKIPLERIYILQPRPSSHTPRWLSRAPNPIHTLSIYIYIYSTHLYSIIVCATRIEMINRGRLNSPQRAPTIPPNKS